MNRKEWKVKKKWMLSLLIVGLFPFFGAASAYAQEIVQIMHTNDMHGRLEYLEDQYSPSIGMGRLATFKQEEAPTLLVDAGDAMQGLPISNYSKGMDMVAAMNAVGYDAMTLGNHEFDFGLDVALAYKDKLNFPIVSANIFYKDSGTRPFDPYTIVTKEVDGQEKNFALIGLTTPETSVKTHPKNVEKVTFKKPVPVAEAMINEIGDQADYYVFMTHLGFDETTVKDETSTYLAEQLAKKFPNKKIFIADGHSHSELPDGKRVGNVLLGQTGNYLNNVGMMTGEQKGQKWELSATLYSFAELKSLTPDPEVEAIVQKAKANFDQEMSKTVVENNPITLNGERDNVRTRETNLGDLIADALMAYSKTGFKQPSDFAVVNGGGIRQTVKPGKVTKGDIVGVMPFGNTVSQVEITGNEMYAMFEHSLRSIHATDKNGKVITDENGLPLLGANGGFLQVSDSVKVTFDPTKQGADPEKKQAGKRVSLIQIRDKAGKWVDVPRKNDVKYKMTTNDFLAAGGDGYTMLAGKPVQQGPSLDEAFMTYFKGLKTNDYAQYKEELPYKRIIPQKEVNGVALYRLYNRNNSEHFYTQSAEEKDSLVKVGWVYEGIAWLAPKEGDKVYRLYNPNSGEHHYTRSEKERNYVIKAGWRNEGVGWHTAPDSEIPIYRIYNPNAKDAGGHHYTRSKLEADSLIEAGWKDEKIGWWSVG